MTDFFTADTHFQHAGKPQPDGSLGGIIKYARRPFASVEEMDEALIRNWNAVVGQDDDVWHLGDFAMGNQDRVPALRARLNGRVHLIWGNHDKRETIIRSGCFDSVQDVARIWIGRDFIYMSHYGHRVWEGSHKGSYQFYGHSHGDLPPINRSCDVGVDCWDYQPVTFEQIKRRLNQQGLNGDPKANHPRRS